ncbi:MAG: hypothetical protein K5878_21145 [Rhizobiaceae bacterium]|nr:hypothetical protein [Rhizobiaceae bacterium]
MNMPVPSTSFHFWLLAALVAVAAAATGLAFAGWTGNGAAMFMALVESGLALCF